MTTRATGRTKNILLTIWLCLPILVVGGLVAGIFIAYSKGPAMDARPVGQGRGDTGGANALGEWLAGNDPNEVERIRRDLREGRLIDPLDWPRGIRLIASPRDTSVPAHTLFLWGGEGGPVPQATVTAGFENPASPANAIDTLGYSKGALTLSQSQLRMIFADGRPGAGLYASPTPTVSTSGARVYDAQGQQLERIPLTPVQRTDAVDGEPIDVVIPLGDG